MYCVVGDFSKIDKVTYERKLLRLKDGGTMCVIHFSRKPTTDQSMITAHWTSRLPSPSNKVKG